jgi:hypothetical protein
MKRQLSLIGAVTAAGVLAASSFAGDEQEGQKPQMYSIYKEVVQPAKTQVYEAALKNMIAEFKAYDIDPEKVNFKTIFGPEMGYVFVSPIENFAAMDTMMENWNAVVEIIGKDRFQEMMVEAEAALEHSEFFHVMRRPDLSYVPENPRLTPDEIQYVHYGFYYPIPGKQEQLEEVAKKFVELYKSKNISSGWSIYQSITGTDLPLLVVAHAAKSESDYYSERAKLKELIGEEGEKLGQQAHALVRKVEFKDGYIRPDLSYPGPDMPPAKPTR